MKGFKVIVVFVASLLLFLVCFTAYADQVKPESKTPAAKDSADQKVVPATVDKFVLQFDGVVAFKGFRNSDKLSSLTADFLKRDKRYKVIRKGDKPAGQFLNVVLKKQKKNVQLKVTSEISGALVGTYEAKLARRVSLAEIMGQIKRGVRTVLDYQPESSKVLIKIKGWADDGDTEGSMIEDAIYRAISSEYELVSANPYELPVKDEDVKFLFKGDKKRMKIIRDKTSADLVITGTVHMPKTKNIGGATEAMYKGKVIVRIKAYDLAHQYLASEVILDLNGKGIFSELLYTLFEAAGAKSAEQIKNDLGFLEIKPDQKSEDEEEAGTGGFNEL